MGPADRIDLVELNEHVRRATGAPFRRRAGISGGGRLAPACCTAPWKTCRRSERYDLIVSGLPLNNFAVADVERILAALTALLAPGGTLSFFEYIAVRPARALVSGRSERARLRGIGQAMRAVLDGREIRRDAVWLNVPPAWVHHVRK